jgi:iron complex outermembrane receptor protein
VAARAQAEVELPPVEIVAEKPASQRAPAAESTVVETKQFAGEVRSVAELLGTAPGVTLHTLGGPGQLATVSLRGATPDQSLVLLDGVPLQGPGGGALDLSSLPASLIDRIVVSRGVLGAQYGQGALGGVVELLPIESAGDGKLHGGAELTVGSFGTERLAADVGTSTERGSAVGALQLDHTDGDFNYRQQLTPEIAGSPYYDFTRENADARQGSALARGSLRLSPATELDAVFQGFLGQRGLPGPWTMAALHPRSRELDGGGLAGARLRGLLGDGTFALRAWGRLDRIELRGVAPAGACDDGAPDCPREVQTATAARAELELGRPLGARQWLRLTLAGGEDWVVGAPTGTHQRGLASAALADDVRLGSLSLHPALRVDAVGGDVGLSPGIAGAWRPWPEGNALAPLELRAGWGLSFRAPSFSELYLQQAGVVPNPGLVPERAWSLDAGIAWRTAKLVLSAGAFYSRYRDIIVYELFPPARAKPFNVGEARVAGLELQAVVTLPAGLSLLAAYSYLDSVNERPGPLEGRALSYRPPHRVYLRLAHRSDRLEGYAELNATSSMPRNQSDTAYLPSQLLISAGAGARVAGPLWLDLEAKNLLDDETLQDVFQYPLPGFSLSAIARARF